MGGTNLRAHTRFRAMSGGLALGGQVDTKRAQRYLSTRTYRDNTADVVVCGAGIMGLNVAYQMKCCDPKLKVVVYERERCLGHGSSGWSTGFMRAYYSNQNTMQLAVDGIKAYKNWREYTGLGNEVC